jgi:CspA family cold shock protein
MRAGEMQQAERQFGTVKWFNFSKGYGFLVLSDFSEIFVHINEVKDEVELRKGDKVSFVVDHGKHGKPFARRCEIVGETQ